MVLPGATARRNSTTDYAGRPAEDARRDYDVVYIRLSRCRNVLNSPPPARTAFYFMKNTSAGITKTSGAAIPKQKPYAHSVTVSQPMAAARFRAPIMVPESKQNAALESPCALRSSRQLKTIRLKLKKLLENRSYAFKQAQRSSIATNELLHFLLRNQHGTTTRGAARPTCSEPA